MSTPNPRKISRRKYRLRRANYAQQSLSSLEMERLKEEDGAISEGGNPSAEAVAHQQSPSRRETELQSEVKTLQMRLAESLDVMSRLREDLETQRRRFQKEKDDLKKFAKEEIMRELVNPMDHFALALQSMESARDVGGLLKGVQMIHREFVLVLKQSGLQEINPLGQPFDPNFHDAVSTDYDPTLNDGFILQVMRPGWELKGRVIRPAMVQVNSSKATQPKEPGTGGHPKTPKPTPTPSPAVATPPPTTNKFKDPNSDLVIEFESLDDDLPN
ncbi:MAG: nucleotide exchange factor GrpE [Candidatus Sumerlaeia bacterium]|nr:nucleotide exchange factor GrpE [Candidatus Sumerlaeia bacterium]